MIRHSPHRVRKLSDDVPAAQRLPMHGILVFACLALAAAPGAAEKSAGAPPAGAGPPGMPESLCADGVVVDDGTNETGYGWVPSVVDGRYVQRFDSAWFPTRRLRSVCVCWLRTQSDSEVDFEIEFYESFVDENGVVLPVDDPYAAIPATASEVPLGVEASRFYEFDVQGTTIPEGLSFIGVRWDAAADVFFFVCADKSPATAPVEVFFREELADGWGRALDTSDPTFQGHRALLVRAVAEPLPAPGIPALGGRGLALLALLLAGGGLWLARRF